MTERPSLFAFAGGEPAFLTLATAFHRRCLEDPVLSHPFSHPGNPEHVERLADYWAEVFGGPPRYSDSFGGHSAMLGIHAGQGADEDLGTRFVTCFVQATDDAELPEDAAFRSSLRAYMGWAVGEVLAYSPPDAEVADDLRTPHWGWNGLE
jgi:hemoglobin